MRGLPFFHRLRGTLAALFRHRARALHPWLFRDAGR